MAARRAYDDSDLRHAIEASQSWRAVLRQLGLRGTSGGSIRTVRRRAEYLSIGFGHPGHSTAGTGTVPRTSPPETVASSDSNGREDNTDASPSPASTPGAKQLAPPAPAPSVDMSRLRRAGPMLAAAWFTLAGWDVSWPLEPSRFDLVVSSHAGTRRIQVKTTTARAARTWKVYLSTSGKGRRTYGPDEIDDFFVIDGDLDFYLIPAVVVAGVQAVHLSAYLGFRLPRLL